MEERWHGELEQDEVVAAREHARDREQGAARGLRQGEGGGWKHQKEQVNRVELAAALLDYDIDPSTSAPSRPSLRATQSAILTPFRHILLPTSSDVDAVVPETVSAASLSRSTSLDLQQRYAQSVGGSNFAVLDDTSTAPEDDQELLSEWGLSEVGLPTADQSRTRKHAVLAGAAEGPVEQLVTGNIDSWESRSLPDLSRGRTTSTFTLPTAEALSSSQDVKPTSRVRILETPRSRAMSLGGRMPLDLPAFESLPDFETANVLSSAAVIRRPATALGLATTALSGTPSPGLSPSLSRPITPIDHPQEHEPLSQHKSITRVIRYSTQPRPASAYSTTSAFTSRFDPLVLAQQKAELEKDRPNFVNKEAGLPPKVVLMPAPLAGRPLSPPPKPRLEGPEPESPSIADGEGEAEVKDEFGDDVETTPKKLERPAGALYGRSLLDVLEERKTAIKSQQRGFLPGQDGRPSMMDFKNSPSSLDPPSSHPASLTPHLSTSVSQQKISRSVSVFGPDLIYQREMEQRLQLDAEEEAERVGEDEREKAMWEKERLKEEEKRKGKQRSGALRQLEKRQFVGPPQEPSEASVLPSSEDGDEVLESFATLPSLPRRSLHSVAPSLSLPTSLGPDSFAATADLFAPPSPDSSVSSLDSVERIRRDVARESNAVAHQLRVEDQEQRLMDLRTAVMLGTMTPQEAAREASLLSPGVPGSKSGDIRPIGERLSFQGCRFDPTLPPPWMLSPQVELRGFAETVFPSPVILDDDDDTPLGLKLGQTAHTRIGGKGSASDGDEDDVPLGLLPSAVIAKDEDDRPLAFNVSSATYYHLEQQQQQALQQQAAFQAQQAAMMYAFQQQHHQQHQQLLAQQHQLVAQQQEQMTSGQPVSGMQQFMSDANTQYLAANAHGHGGASSGRGQGIDRWRHGVS